MLQLLLRSANQNRSAVQLESQGVLGLAGNEEVVFDTKARQEFLLGFEKRNKRERKAKLGKLKEEAKVLKRERRRKKRKTLNEVVEHVKQNEEAREYIPPLKIDVEQSQDGLETVTVVIDSNM